MTKGQAMQIDEHLIVSQFVRENWSGSYVTRLHSDNGLGQRIYITTLHSPDGPKVFTRVNPDGTMDDITR